MVTHGIVDKATRVGAIVAVGMDRRYCDICALRGELCTCMTPEIQSQFNGWRNYRRSLFDNVTESINVFGNEYIRSWLSGSWAVEVASIPPFHLDILCFEDGVSFQSSLTYVLQSEFAALLTPRLNHRFNYAATTTVSGTGSSAGSYSSAEVSVGSEDDRSLSTRESGGRRSYECELCGMKFKRGYDVKRHTKSVHEKRKDCICPFCRKGFSQTGHLNEHVRVSHVGSALACLECDKTFGAQSKLDRHVRSVHLNLRQFKCDMCPKEYKDKSALKHHLIASHKECMSDGALEFLVV
eukprot:Plantae.Rhodophyta-Purpureofilum_apyrenoidigerum.ctg14959.p1 GENE.Plantae.Rhodophyta-Purpureofilum_apyrenoidigerum.ctg14959~~Plantae.Rhodophyta-Purpureofilum_apyrenoidigerum.ctg14959.p1  ORF type:complete len:329 (-),score=41.79 Plantae.Rhodophyta-Purpureofilum_apyrenoidigerum.ctg14959:516-1403(-)